MLFVRFLESLEGGREDALLPVDPVLPCLVGPGLTCSSSDESAAIAEELALDRLFAACKPALDAGREERKRPSPLLRFASDLSRNYYRVYSFKMEKMLLRFLPVYFDVFEDVEIGLYKVNFSI